MKNQTRIRETEHKLSPDLWKDLDNLNSSNVELLIESLEKYISNGFFGAAAEISDTLESSLFLKSNQSWRVRVELERMKRYYCLGYDNLLLVASNKVIDYLHSMSTEEQNNDDFLLWKVTAIGHKGWITSSKDDLREITQQCIEIRDKFQDEEDKKERTCFIYALEGRLLYLQKEDKKAEKKFENAISIADKKKFRRSSAHIKIIYAEHLAMNDKWREAVSYAKKFLDNAAELHFKTHLLLRAFILLFKAPQDVLVEEKIDLQYSMFRYQMLIYAMGMSQSQNLNPLLAEARDIIPKNKQIDFYRYDLRTELKKRILHLASEKKGERFENLIRMYYDLLNYNTAKKLQGGFWALDLIAIHKSPLGNYQFEGVQVKSGKNKVSVKDLERYGQKLLETKKALSTGKYTDGIKIDPITVIHWYTIAGFQKPAFDALVNDVKHSIGENCVIIETDLDALVDNIFNKTEILVRIIFSKELEVE